VGQCVADWTISRELGQVELRNVHGKNAVDGRVPSVSGRWWHFIHNGICHYVADIFAHGVDGPQSEFFVVGVAKYT
jgi:hypothetical protein